MGAININRLKAQLLASLDESLWQIGLPGSILHRQRAAESVESG
jgi:hypothetical protein